ncbi:uncharacterized protein LOC123530095 [Mercenaria mercenaria]|uniref:uncharacterized protein LOC123530095 n=1 Tax=Mercenaria mercenaria TaxID=6596 RepID=UPI00234E8C96|nr:uncharacterized protein LOC123530095 [Mercenaria mercenaria]
MSLSHYNVYVLVFVFLIGIQHCGAADYCVFNSGQSYCDNGCCTDACCDMSTLAIIGLVIGAILSLAAVAGCIVCLVCMCKQSSANSGANMVQPMPNNSNTVYVHNAPNHPPPRAAPPSYGQYGSYPGSADNMYGFNDAAYPPGSHPPPAYSYSNPRSDKY